MSIDTSMVMMMQIYKVVEQGKENVRTIGFYQYKRAAEAKIGELEKWRMSRILHKAVRMVGWKRGKNAQAFRDLIAEAGNSPYKIEEVSINSSYR